MLEHNGLEYEDRGEGEAVLLIHGSHIAGSFLPFMKDSALSDRYRLIRYHRRGFAGSGPVPSSFRIEEQARDARSLLTHLGVERAHVVGHSYGGAISLQLALDAPDVVHSLALLEPALMGVPSGPALVEAIAPAAERFASGDTAAAVDRFLSVVGGVDWKSLTPATVPGGPEQAERDGATFFETEMPALMQWVFDVDRADRITPSVLYVIGGESAKTLEVFASTGAAFDEGAQLVRSWLPQTREALVPGVNHLLQIQNPGLLAKTIAEFLLGHPQ